MSAIISSTAGNNALLTPVRLLYLHLMSFPTATSALAAWISAQGLGSDTIRAKVLGQAYCNDGATRKGGIATRRVLLTCGPNVLSDATIVYRDYLLPADLRSQLRSTDLPFGEVVKSLGPSRRTTFASLTAAPRTVISHEPGTSIHANPRIARDGHDGRPWPDRTGLWSILTAKHVIHARTRTRHATQWGGGGDMTCWLNVHVRYACC